MKDLTIVVPLYNKFNYIQQCLESIRVSVHDIDWECIVVDDGSDDGSTGIAKEFCNAYSDRFTYVQCLRNHGLYPSYARNMGIRMADSEFITFFDADDQMCDGYLDRGVVFMRENPDYYLYSEAFYCVYQEENYGEYYEYYEFKPYSPMNDIDLPGFLHVGGGGYTRGIFKTSEVKKFRFKDVLLEDSIFMLDYLYPCKKMKLNTSQFSFMYFICRSEQDKFAIDKLSSDNHLSDRQYLYKYVKDTYPDYYQAFIENNGNYKPEIAD